ncbi:MAG: hypothetical protein JWN70_926 [Planctomycetaceae bacterium]|nr:hypothetical protein [Planctomycetaceae bacterium]
MTAAYYVSQADPTFLRPHEAELLSLLETANGYSGSIALALGRMKSPKAKPVIASMLSGGWWPQETFREAMSFYGSAT